MDLGNFMVSNEEELYLKEILEQQLRYELLTDIAAAFLVLFVCFFTVNNLLDIYKKKDDYL